jgi:hypothetical protein
VGVNFGLGFDLIMLISLDRYKKMNDTLEDLHFFGIISNSENENIGKKLDKKFLQCKAKEKRQSECNHEFVKQSYIGGVIMVYRCTKCKSIKTTW